MEKKLKILSSFTYLRQSHEFDQTSNGLSTKTRTFAKQLHAPDTSVIFYLIVISFLIKNHSKLSPDEQSFRI